MNKYVIRGGRPLFGEVTISGAKNAAVGIIPAALLVAALTALGICPAFLISATEWLVTALTDSLSIIASM